MRVVVIALLIATMPTIKLAFDVQPVIIAPMIEVWPIDDTLNPWLNNAK